MKSSDHLDNKIRILSITPLTKRRGLSQKTFNHYWKNIHGPVCARLPHVGLYVQHHLKRLNTNLLPPFGNIHKRLLPENNWDGFAEIGFFSPGEMEKWLPATAILFDDEQNVFDKTVAHYCRDSSLTVKDRSDAIMTNGTDGRQFIYLFIRKKQEVAQPVATSFLKEHFLPALTSSRISRVRYHILEAHDNSKPNPPAPNVAHFMDDLEQHQFVIELGADSKLEIKQVFQQDHFRKLMAAAGDIWEAIHPFESDGRYTMVYDGNITQAGLRGSTNAQLIRKVGAVNQVSADVMQLMLSGWHHDLSDATIPS